MFHYRANGHPCCGRDGRPKRGYATEDEARWVAQDQFERTGQELRVYYCPDCGQYHLTKSQARAW